MTTGWLPSCRTPSASMAALDRLDWAVGMSIYAYGQRIGLRTNDLRILPEIAERLPPGCEPGCSPWVDRLYSVRSRNGASSTADYFHEIYAGATRIARTLNLEEALDAFESDIQTHVAQHAANRVFVHAGVVGWRDQAILIAAPSLAGKSTVVAALLRRGATYYSDEYAVLDGRGQVHAFARRISLRRAPREALLRPTAADLGARLGDGPLPIGLVVFCEYQPGARWALRRLARGVALGRLLNSTFAAAHEPEMATLTLERALAGAVVIEAARGEADQAAEAMLRYVDGLPPRSAKPPRAA
jgi:hypothetical protein